MKINFANKVGIVQGRLTKTKNNELQVFPQEKWKEEFNVASKLNLNFIELLSEIKHNKQNPIWHKNGQRDIIKNSQETDLEIYSACSDFIIDNSLLNSKNNYDYILNFFTCLELLNCKKAILPLMGQSEIEDSNLNNFASLIKDLQIEASKRNIKILIESFLSYRQLIKLLNKVGPPVKAVFDTGNIINKIPSIYSEISNLRDYIGHVHIKDKLSNNESSLLGQGIVNFIEVFKALEEINYKEAFVLETPRGINPILTCQYNLNFLNFMFSEAHG